MVDEFLLFSFKLWRDFVGGSASVRVIPVTTMTVYLRPLTVPHRKIFDEEKSLRRDAHLTTFIGCARVCTSRLFVRLRHDELDIPAKLFFAKDVAGLSFLTSRSITQCHARLPIQLDKL